MRKLNALIAGSTGYIGVQLVKLLDKFDFSTASELYLEAVDFCTNLVNEKEIVGLGELGRPHFPVNDKIWNLSNEVLQESLVRAKEVDASVGLHTETGTPDVMADLSNIASKASFPKSRLVKHYGGIGAIKNSHGLTVSLLASNENITYASENNHSHMLETDYLDDPKRPGAVLGPKTVPRQAILEPTCSNMAPKTSHDSL